MACTSYKLGAITTSCGSNIPSIKRLWVGAFGAAAIKHSVTSDTATDYEDVDLYMDGNTPVVDNDGKHIIADIKNAALAQDAEPFVEFSFRKNTCSANSEMTTNDNGSFYWTNSVNMVFAKQDAAKRLSIQALASGDCSAIYEDGNGNYWMIGLDEPVSMTAGTAETGTSVSDTNQYTLTISEDSPVLPVPLLAANAETIITTLTA